MSKLLKVLRCATMPLSSALLRCCAALLLPTLATAASSSDGFQLYGYGEGIGGLPVLSDGGLSWSRTLKTVLVTRTKLNEAY
jgi:hypothetical protein